MKINNVAKVLVLDDQGKVLLLKRSTLDSYAAGRFDYPGGGIDEGEGPDAAASRELKEEAGLEVPTKDLKLIFAGTVKDDKVNASVNRLFYACRVQNQTVSLSHEHSEHLWVSIDEVLEMFPHWFYGKAIEYAREYDLLP